VQILGALDNFPFVVIFLKLQYFETITEYTPSNVERAIQQSLCIAYRP